MKEIVYKYRKLIWIWVVAHATMLAFNLLNIRGGNSGAHLFTDYYSNPQRDLWPFVKFAETNYGSTMYGGSHEQVDKFHGIFYQYDWTEFLLYVGLLVVFLTYKA